MTTRMLTLASAALLALACSDGEGVSSPADGGGDRRAEAFQAAVQHVTEDMAFDRVDPRPVRLGGSVSEPLFPNAGSYLEADSSLVAARSAAVRELGLRPGRLLPLRENCTGFLVPPQVKETSGCPEKSREHLVLGQLQQKDGRWRMPVIESSCSPTGLSWTYYHMWSWSAGRARGRSSQRHATSSRTEMLRKRAGDPSPGVAQRRVLPANVRSSFLREGATVMPRRIRGAAVLAALMTLVAGCGEGPAPTQASDPGPPELHAELGEHSVPATDTVTTPGKRDPWTCEESPACMSLLDEGAVGPGRIAALRDSLLDELPPLRR